MILIISHNSMDHPTEAVYDWIEALGHRCLRVNGADLTNNFGFKITKSSTNLNDVFCSNKIDLSSISAVWVRRWMTSNHHKTFTFQGKNIAELNLLSENIKKQLISEFKALTNHFFLLLKNKPSLGNPFYDSQDPNKAEQLTFAIQAGLDIPETMITDRKVALLEFIDKNKKVICKNISELCFLDYSNVKYGTYTSIISLELADELPEYFYPSLFQKAITKQFEVRIFYLEGEFYSMAIFSSNDVQTEIDFRKFNFSKPNRNVPIALPDTLKEKISYFMKLCNLTTGSIDMIYSDENEYIFLEVNPIGQFGMVSSPCNYYIEKAVAEHLIRISNNEKLE